MTGQYALLLEKPELRRLQRAKFAWDIVLIIASGLISYLLMEGDADIQPIVGEVLTGAGLMPTLLSLPIILADWSIGMGTHRSCRSLFNFFCFRDKYLLVGFSFFTLCGISGIFLLWYSEGDGGGIAGWDCVKGVLSEIFAEICVIFGITRLLNVPSVETDETKTFLSVNEAKQVERSGCLNASHADATDFALEGDYHEDMHYYYPNDLTSDYDEVESRIYDEVYGEEALPHSRVAAECIMDRAAGWDSAYYVAALGRCDRQVIKDHLDGLLAYISGATGGSDRFLVQSAITSLGNLYFDSGNRKISQRMWLLWLRHEVSNVRDSCEVALKAINDRPLVNFMKEVTSPTTITNVAIADAYFTQASINTAPLHSASLEEATRHISTASGSLDERVMACIAACLILGQGDHAPSSPSQEAIRGFILSVAENIVFDPIEFHLVSEIALEAVRRAIAKGLESTMLQATWYMCLTACRNSVFKMVRKGGFDALKQAEYPYLGVLDCFGEASTLHFAENGFNTDAIRELLEDRLGSIPFNSSDLHDTIRDKLDVDDPLKHIEEKYKALERAGFAGMQNRNLASLDADPTLLLYVYLGEDHDDLIPDTFIQERLNAQDRLERYVGLVCLGRFQYKHKELVKKVLASFINDELVSDVRGLAEVVQRTQRQYNENANPFGRCYPSCLEQSDEVGDKRVTLIGKEMERLREKVKERDEGIVSSVADVKTIASDSGSGSEDEALLPPVGQSLEGVRVTYESATNGKNYAGTILGRSEDNHGWRVWLDVGVEKVAPDDEPWRLQRIQK